MLWTPVASTSAHLPPILLAVIWNLRFPQFHVARPQLELRSLFYHLSIIPKIEKMNIFCQLLTKTSNRTQICSCTCQNKLALQQTYQIYIGNNIQNRHTLSTSSCLVIKTGLSYFTKVVESIKTRSAMFI